MNKLLEFYNGGYDNKGRRLDDILSWSDEEWENCHDYIQWVFPTKEKSEYNIEAPVLDDESIEMFRNSLHLLERSIDSLKRYLSFLEGNTGIWMCEYNHNHLRITRVIKFLICIEMNESAKHFARFVIGNGEHYINKESINIWKGLVKYL